MGGGGVSLYIAAGIIGVLMNILDKYTKEAKAEGKAAAQPSVGAGEAAVVAHKPLLLTLLELPLRLTGKFAAWLARVLRGVPKHLQ